MKHFFLSRLLLAIGSFFALAVPDAWAETNPGAAHQRHTVTSFEVFWGNSEAGSTTTAGKMRAMATPTTFSYNGTDGSDGSAQTYTVPAGVYNLFVVANGAAGGTANRNGDQGYSGGLGGQVEGLLAVTPGQVLTIMVGGTPTAPATGYNGGGSGAGSPDHHSGGGGGATDIRLHGSALTNRVLVAGGGGGGPVSRSGGVGGVGGGLTGGTGQGAIAGGGGTQSNGGAGGSGTFTNGQSGSLGFGGDGLINGFTYSGGGGGGYFGGGSGGDEADGNGIGGITGSGGGGSSYTDPGYVTNAAHTQGTQSGNGQVVILPITPNAPATSTTFSYNGTDGSDGSAQSYTVPYSVYSLSVIANGAAGGRSGGLGGQVEGLLAVTPGQVLTITVGGTPAAQAAGYNGGGSQGGGGGTDIRMNGSTLSNRVLVAGGGGGGTSSRSGGPAGVGGGLTGGAGQGRSAGGGGTQSRGGAGGSGAFAQSGSRGTGGDGAISNYYAVYVSGGGGGGYFGGGSGGELFDGDGLGGTTGSGGGGSSYTEPGYVTDVVHTQGTQSGNGQVVILPIRTETETPPVATANANQTTTIGVAFFYAVNAFTDAEGDALTYSASISPSNGFSFDPATRVISGTPTNTEVSSVTVTATDPGNLSANTTFTITVNPVPVVTPLSLGFTASPTQLLTSGTTTLSATVSGGTPPYSYTFSGPGTITATGNTASVSGLSAGVQTFTVFVEDATTTPASQTISGTVSVSVSQANSAPVATANDNQTATVGGAFSYTVNTFTDAEGQALTYSASISPANGFSFDPATRVISGTPTNTGVSSVTVTATDPGSLSASTTFTITVNPAPVTVTPLSLGFTASPTQLLTSGTTTLSATVSGGTPPYSYTFSGPGTITATGNTASVSGLSAGVQTFTVFVEDATTTPASQTISGTVSVSVSQANSAPVATANDNQTATVGGAFSYTVKAFTDAEGQALTYSASISPTNGFSFDPATRVISGTPTNTGVSSVTVTATDPGSLSANTTFTITVSPAPVASGSFDGFVNGADCGTFRGWAWDRNKPNTAVSIDILDGVTVIGALLAGDFRQDLLDAGKGNGKHAFRFSIPESIKDGLSHTLSARVSGSSFLLKDSPKALICTGTAQPGNKPPVPPTPTVLNAPLTAQVGVPFSGTLVAFTDPEGSALTYALAGLPDGLSIQMNSRVISGTPTQSGSFVLTYSATDAGGANNSVSFVLTVNPAETTTVTGSFEGYLDKVECGTIRGWVWDRKLPNTPVTVEFYTSTTVWGSVVANIYRADLKNAGKGNGAHAYGFTVPAALKDNVYRAIYARVQGSTFVLKDSGKPLVCAPVSPARLSAETGSELEVTVLGNPVTDQVVVEVRGVQGQPLRLQLTDLSGRLVTERQIDKAGAVERQSLNIGAQPSGLLLLQATSGQQSVTLKVLKP